MICPGAVVLLLDPSATFSVSLRPSPEHGVSGTRAGNGLLLGRTGIVGGQPSQCPRPDSDLLVPTAKPQWSLCPREDSMHT